MTPAPVETPVRVRFAPSPTGYLHVGGLRTALYNYLFARRYGGRFVLRIEDTDRTRFVEDAEADILECLSWAGLLPDEGPDRGGPCSPYRQSERQAMYLDRALALVASGHAYYAFDTPEALEALRGDDAATRYDASTRGGLRNSLALPETEWKALLHSGEPWVIRLRVDPSKTVTFEDLIRGTVTFSGDTIDDQVLVKSDGMPTYHLANVVDDHEMGITHVIRGEEWLPSTPKHMLLYDAFGWRPPRMAHLPLIMSPSGGKLSKRSADRLGIPVMVKDYRKVGYEPEALVNYLAFLGWNPGDDRELFDTDSLVQAFSLDRVGSSGVQFDMDKLAWFNQQHLKAMPASELGRRARPWLDASGLEPEPSYVVAVADLMRERLLHAKDLAGEWRFFFEDPAEYEREGIEKRWKEDSAELVSAYADAIEACDPFDAESLEARLRELAESRGVGAGRLIHPVRLAVSGRIVGPGLFEMLALLGRQRCVARLRTAARSIPAPG